MMKILFLSAHPAVSLSDAQGYAIRISELIRALREMGHEVVPLIAGDQKGRQTAKRIYKNRIKRLIPSQLAQVMRELSFLFLDRQFYTHAYREVKAIAPDAILERYSFFNRTGMRLANQIGVPLVLDDVSPTWEEEEYFQRALKGLAHRIQRQVFTRADALIAVSTPIKNYLTELGMPPEKVHLIHNGADTNLFSPEIDGTEIRQRFGLKNKMVVGFVGGFLPWQGMETLLDVALDMDGKAQTTAFLLVGPADHWSSTDASIQKKMEVARRNGSVIFSGPLPHEEVPKYLGAMDIVTVPDFNDYGCPIKIFEYMAMGKPLVAPRVPSIDEIVSHGHDGWLMEKSGQENLKAAIELFVENPELRRQMGANARETALQKYTWLKIAEQLESVLNGVARPHSRPGNARGCQHSA